MAAAVRIPALLRGGKAQRQEAYAELTALAKPDYGGDDGESRVSVARACVGPIVDVRCAEEARVDASESQQASLVLARLVLMEPLAVGSVYLQDDAWLAAYVSPGNALAAMTDKEPAKLNRSDMMLAACDVLATFMVLNKSFTDTVESAGLDELEAFGTLMKLSPFMMERAPRDDRNLRLSELALETLRDPQCELLELELAAVWSLVCLVIMARPVVCGAVSAPPVFLLLARAQSPRFSPAAGHPKRGDRARDGNAPLELASRVDRLARANWRPRGMLVADTLRPGPDHPARVRPNGAA